MAPREEIEHFLADHVPSLKDGLAEESKDQLSGLIDYYESYGYTKDQLAEQLTHQVPQSTLDESSAEEFTKAVAELAAPAPSEAASQDGQEVQEPSAPSDSEALDRMMQDLAAALAQDANAEIEATKQDLFAYVLGHLWEEVRPELEAELEASDQEWASVEEAKAAVYEPAYKALMDAAEGLCDAGDEEGGYAALLSRPAS